MGNKKSSQQAIDCKVDIKIKDEIETKSNVEDNDNNKSNYC